MDDKTKTMLDIEISDVSILSKDEQETSKAAGQTKRASVSLSKKKRRFSNLETFDAAIRVIAGRPHVRHDWKIFWWAFFVHLLYPFGTLYVYFFNGKQAFEH